MEKEAYAHKVAAVRACLIDGDIRSAALAATSKEASDYLAEHLAKNEENINLLLDLLNEHELVIFDTAVIVAGCNFIETLEVCNLAIFSIQRYAKAIANPKDMGGKITL